jgi:Xaa-Pro aminopeptidase
MAYPQSEEELAVIRYAAEVGDDVALAMIEATRPGIPESEIYAAGMAAAPLAIGRLPEASDYHLRAEIPPILHELELKEGMTFAFEPNCAFGRRVANLGGTVVVGEAGAIELNPLTARVHAAEEVALAV